MIGKVLRNYAGIELHVRKIIFAQFCLQAVNTAFFLLLNYYMTTEGYADHEAAEVFSYRFFAVMFLAFPLGLFIKGRRLKPFFLAASVMVPLFSTFIILSIDYQWDRLLYYSTMFWGLGYTCMQITILPYIVLNTSPKNHSEAISLSFLSFSVTLCVVGMLNFILQKISPEFFNEKNVLLLITLLSSAGIYFVATTRVEENLSQVIPLRKVIGGYDWGVIFRALIPSFIIAVGAGFTIPVINLFFLNVHGVESGTFSVIGSLTFALVATVMLFMPLIRRRFGYGIAITLFQSLSVFALLMLALTEYYNHWQYAVYVAIFFYVMRQPLMSAAAPMTSEMIMYYVGKKNQEIIAALNASIWSGSWFVSMKIFQWLRILEFRYVTIFLITVVLYVIGVAWYASLVYAYQRKTGQLRSQKKSRVLASVGKP